MLGASGRYCSADERALAAIGRGAGDQVRVWRGGDDFEVVLRTRSDADSEQGTVRLTQRLVADDGTAIWIGQGLDAREAYADEIAEATVAALADRA